jgi:hypothetical protein
MRRLRSISLLVLLVVCLSPVPAHAYFWEWLDSLSGPKFGGGTLEFKVWCVTDRRGDVLTGLRNQLAWVRKVHLDEYETSKSAPIENLAPRQQFIRRGIDAAAQADRMFRELENNVGGDNLLTLSSDAPLNGRSKPLLEGDVANKFDAGEYFWEALQWREYALGQFAWADRVLTVTADDAVMRAAAVQKLPVPRFMRPAKVRLVKGFAVPVNLSASFCSAGPIDRHKQALNFTYEFASDHKAENSADNSRMHKFGASYHFIPAPWVSFGFGAGRAFFKSDGVDWFGKWYVEPHIVDIRPLAIGQRRYSPEAWRQVFYVRVNSLWFVNGFEAGRFSRGTSLPLGNELITSIGIHADVSPVIRKARRRW